jgi:hypothetical protein
MGLTVTLVSDLLVAVPCSCGSCRVGAVVSCRGEASWFLADDRLQVVAALVAAAPLAAAAAGG